MKIDIEMESFKEPTIKRFNKKMKTTSSIVRRCKCVQVFAIMFFFVGIAVICSCNDRETYADQKKRERAAIAQFIESRGIKRITEQEFREQNFTTNVEENQFVEFRSTGVYMQIVRKGTGSPLADGETATVLCRFNEYNLLTDSLQLSNNVLMYQGDFDKFSVTNTSGTYKATFVSGVMPTWYGSQAVPAGWLTPLPYINLCFPDNIDEEIAKVNIIVPHTQGHSKASAGVYPCYYELTYQRGR